MTSQPKKDSEEFTCLINSFGDNVLAPIRIQKNSNMSLGSFLFLEPSFHCVFLLVLQSSL